MDRWIDRQIATLSSHIWICFYSSSESWINKLSIDVWFVGTIFDWDTTIWKSGIWGCKKNIDTKKCAFKVVQMKFSAMHITNQKLIFIFKVGKVLNIFMKHDLYLISQWLLA